MRDLPSHEPLYDWAILAIAGVMFAARGGLAARPQNLPDVAGGMSPDGGRDSVS